MKPQHITLIGGGLVGSLLSVLLARRGYRVTIYEKRPDMRTTRIPAGRSINLALAQRGMAPLEMAGLMEQVREQLVTMRGRMIHQVDGQLELLPYGQRDHEVIYSVPRGSLNKLMMSAAEQTGQVEFHFNQSCESVDFQQKTLGMVNEVTGQRSTVEFERLIGTDGSGSNVRQAMVDQTDGHYSMEMLDHCYKELCIPSTASGGFRMEKEALHIWPRGGYMLIALPNLDGSFTVTLFLPSQGDPSFETLQDEHALGDFFRTQFPDVLQMIPDLQHDFFENPTGVLGTVRCFPWTYQNTVLLLGDASHAIVPFHGQGMNAGFEDCGELMKCLERHQDDWELVLPDFQQLRKPNTDAIAEMALENYVVMRDSVRDPDFLLKKELGFRLERLYPQQFVPRYSMVMFHQIPYAEAYRRGQVQEEILSQLVAGVSSADQVDFELARSLVQQQLPVMPQSG